MNLNSFSQQLFSSASSAYSALQGNAAAKQTANETIVKLVERVRSSAAEGGEGKRASLVALKSLARDWKADVGAQAMDVLVETLLDPSTAQDVETEKALLETLVALCESDFVEEDPAVLRPAKTPDVGLQHTTLFLHSPQTVHVLLQSLAQTQHFYVRFFTLQLLSTLLQNRPERVQELVLASTGGVGGVMACLEERREVLRNEALLLLHNLTVTNADLQKIVAFEGAFERLLDIVIQEGGVEGGIVVQDCLAAVGTLLRFNTSNQNYFRELSLLSRLPPLLSFPSPAPPPSQPPPDTFALQFWPEQKVVNSALVLSIARLLAGGGDKGGSGALASCGMTRCLVELVGGSNAPTSLKVQALSALAAVLEKSPRNAELLTALAPAPLVPLPPDPEQPQAGIGYSRLAPRPFVAILVGLAVDGEARLEDEEGREGRRVRREAARVWEVLVGGDRSIREGVVSMMGKPVPEANPNDAEEVPSTAGALLLSALTEFPTPSSDPNRPMFASILLSHLLRNSETAKKLACAVSFPSSPPPAAGATPDDDDDDDEPVTLMQVIVGNLMMALREAGEATNRELQGHHLHARKSSTASQHAEDAGPRWSSRDWNKAVVGWLVALSTWLWDSPASVKEFLSEGSNVQVLIQPITQASGVDPLVSGLSAFLLGTCYEFNRTPGEITRTTLHPILHSRIGPDQFVSRMARFREDARFKAVGPPEGVWEEDEGEGELVFGLTKEEREEVWLDWSFVEFWKNNYYTIQRSINADPEMSQPADADSESASLITSLRMRVASQAEELETLQEKMTAMKREHEEELRQREEERAAVQEELASVHLSISTLTGSLSAAEAKAQDATKEQEDLLVLLEELSEKRRKDKERMKEKGLDVSEDEGDDDDDDDEEDEEDEDEKDEDEKDEGLA